MFKIEQAVKFSDYVAIGSLVVSIISAFISGFIFFIQHNFSKKNSIKNLDTIYFNKIFQETLVHSLPYAQRKIFVDLDGNIKDDEAFIKLLNEIRNESVYFRYADKSFYDKLVKNLQDLEDYIIGRRNSSVTDRNNFNQTIQEKVENLYKLLIDYYKNL